MQRSPGVSAGFLGTGFHECTTWPLDADIVHFAVNGKQSVFGHTLVKYLYVRILDGRSDFLAIMVVSTM